MEYGCIEWCVVMEASARVMGLVWFVLRSMVAWVRECFGGVGWDGLKWDDAVGLWSWAVVF